ncbi:MAG TPA: hypothetical protein VHA75_17110 [Rugosimonospora sp.]|nr:hypothetical protein [Rugosimonospora sp.]
MTGPNHLWAATEFLNPAVMEPVQNHMARTRSDYDEALTTAGPIVPYIRSSIDSQVKAITDDEVQSAAALLLAIHGLTFGDDQSIAALRDIVANAEADNTTVANSFNTHTGHP